MVNKAAVPKGAVDGEVTKLFLKSCTCFACSAISSFGHTRCYKQNIPLKVV